MEQIRASELRIGDVIEVDSRHFRTITHITTIPFTGDIEVEGHEEYTCWDCWNCTSETEDGEEATCGCFEDRVIERHTPDELIEIIDREWWHPAG